LTGYLYDGDCVVAEFDARGKVEAQYIHGQGLGADVGSLICAQTLGADGAASERYYSHNWRGDVIGITDESGASLARYRYGAFGELIAGDGVIANNILFSGKRYDSASGLYYFGARYYDASSGRFISRDPMGYIDGPNDYVLAMNNPLLWIDPWGLCRGNTLYLSAYRRTEATYSPSLGFPIGYHEAERNTHMDVILENNSKNGEYVAMVASRPLGFPFNIFKGFGPFRHDQILFSDGDNQGFFQRGVDIDIGYSSYDYTLNSQYNMIYDGDIMKQAIDNVAPNWSPERYQLISGNTEEKDMDGLVYTNTSDPWDKNNCHGYPADVIKEYNRLKENK